MGGDDITLTLDHINGHVGRPIEYYEMWDIQQESFFRGGCLIQGVYNDPNNGYQATIYATGIWGQSLNGFYADDQGYIRNPANPQQWYWLGPMPYALYQIVWEEAGEKKIRYVAGDSYSDIQMQVELLTDQLYEAWRINLDGSLYDDKSQFN